MSTNPEPHCVCHLVRGGCRQGRACPISETEAANGIALRVEFPAPKGKKRMNYRPSSSAYTGRAPRSMRDAFGCHINDQLHPMPDGSLSPLHMLGRVVVAMARIAVRVAARLFGR